MKHKALKQSYIFHHRERTKRNNWIKRGGNPLEEKSDELLKIEIRLRNQGIEPDYLKFVNQFKQR